MSPLPYTNSGARTAFYAVFVTFLLLEYRIRLRSRINPQGDRSDAGSLLVVWLTIVPALAGGFELAASAHWAAITVARWPLFIVGVILMAIGTAIRQWAVALLGQFFTVDVRIHPEQTVVDTGPYRWVRHPSYTGMLITFLGIGLALGNWAALIVLIVLPTIGLVIRIHVEERALLKGLGEPYRRFAATRAHLIPGVW